MLYLGAHYVMKSTNSGASWQAMSTDLTLNLSDNSAGKGLGTVYTIRSFTGARGCDLGGLIQVTRDGGAAWRNVTPPGLSARTEVSLIEASHFDAGTAYAAVNRYALDDLNAPFRS